MTGDVADQILEAASRLIGEHGLAQTSVSRIAREVGLTQSALYYYFAGKNEILAALVARFEVVPLTSLERIVSEGGSAAVQLYRFVRSDVRSLCAVPFELNEMQRIATQARDQFADYWTEIDRLERGLADLIRRGIDDGEFSEVDTELAAVAILANDEGAQNRHRQNARWPIPRMAEFLAGMAVGGLTRPGVALDDIRRAADELDAASA